MGVISVNFWYWVVQRLPKRLVYFCALWVMAKATTGEYSNTSVVELTGLDAIKRYEDQFKLFKNR